MGLDIMVTLFAQFSNDNYYYVIGTPPGNRCQIRAIHLINIDNETSRPTDCQRKFRLSVGLLFPR